MFVDCNVPMYAAGAPGPYKDRCGQILRWISEGALAATSDAEVFQEILYRYGHIRRIDLGRVVFDSFQTVLDDVLPVTMANVRRAEALARQHEDIGPRDLLHAAVMEGHGIRQIVSADKGFDRLAGIERIDPLDLVAPPGASTS